MPELPEVHTITTDLNKHIKDAVITNVWFDKDFPKFAKSKVIGKKIKKATRIAKNIVIELENDLFLTIHLAMTGRVLLRKKDFPKDKWMRIVFSLEKEGKQAELRYCDMRMFGKVKLHNSENIQKLKAKYGPEITSTDLEAEEFLQRIKLKRTNVKNALLDQKLIAGLGNIYVNDALWMAQIHPETRTKDLEIEDAIILLQAAKAIIEEAINNRGSTLPDKMYVDIFGKPGNQQEFWRIYSKNTCSRCKGKVKFRKLNGRGTYFCPTCQPHAAS
jgi:formamidopyrimidine-DNA glycosylase